MRLLPSLSALILLSISGCTSTNALWNDGGHNKPIAFWLYNTTGSCPSIRQSPPFVFASKYDVAGVSAKNVSVQELRYCFELFPKTPRSEGNRCESGEVSYTYLPEQNRYSGFYRFKLTDGTVLQGDFLAEYCPKSDPRP